MSTMRVADYAMSFVAKIGVKAVFLVPGGGSMHMVDALAQRKDIIAVPNHHEQASAIAAEAYARAGGGAGRGAGHHRNGRQPMPLPAWRAPGLNRSR